MTTRPDPSEEGGLLGRDSDLSAADWARLELLEQAGALWCRVHCGEAEALVASIAMHQRVHPEEWR